MEDTNAATSDNVFKQLATTDSTDLTNETPPSPQVVDFLHALASTTRPEDVHHQQGTDVTQVNPGNHQHNGLDSYQILYGAGIVLPADPTGSSTTAQLAASIVALNAIARGFLGAS